VSGEVSPSHVKVDPHLAQNPRNRPGDELNLAISPSVMAQASRLNATKTETGAPLCLRQLWQWHHATAVGAPLATNRTAPQRHRPSIWLLILPPLSCGLSGHRLQWKVSSIPFGNTVSEPPHLETMHA
jgi:hypothetical protein